MPLCPNLEAINQDMFPIVIRDIGIDSHNAKWPGKVTFEP